MHGQQQHAQRRVGTTPVQRCAAQRQAACTPLSRTKCVHRLAPLARLSHGAAVLLPPLLGPLLLQPPLLLLDTVLLQTILRQAMPMPT
jgi:hypothetical protein